MLDFLFALIQFLCLLGLLYGALLCLVHRDCVDSLRSPYDPLIGHDWIDKPPVVLPTRSAPQPPEEAPDERLAA